MDLFPTTLAAMNVRIEGDRLGLGTNLYGTRKTLLEEQGRDKLEQELECRSKLMDRMYQGKYYSPALKEEE